MIEKIIRVRNVGRLRRVDAAGDVAWRPVTLVFAENGRGKSTLCCILRSIGVGDAAQIAGRQTLGTSESQEIQLLIDGAVTIFRDGGWSGPDPRIDVFDTTFVHANVYAGDYVDHEHKRNLYRVIVGEEGVRLAQRVDALDAEIRDIDRELAGKRRELGAIATNMRLEDFIALEQDDQVNTRLQRAIATVEAIQRSAEIAAKPLVRRLEFPSPPTGTMQVLSRSLEDIEEEAEATVRTHLREHTAGAPESWVSQGLGYTKEDACPYCAQSLVGVELVPKYRAFFSGQYRALRSEVERLRADLEAIASPGYFDRLEQAVTANDELLAYWSQFTPLDPLELDIPQVRDALERFTRAFVDLTDRKLGNLLQPVRLDAEHTELQRNLERARRIIDAYNEQVAARNALIDAKKRDTAAGNLVEATVEVSRLEWVKKRHEQEVVEQVTAYDDTVQRKASKELEKARAKERLDEHTSEILRRFEVRINDLLEIFGASFRIGGTDRQYRGGRPSSTYQIVINGSGIDLGDARNEMERPCFGNTLSAGDRSTLALAFFIAKAELDGNLAEKILVFDDPFSSQDRSRRTCTQQQLVRLAGRSRQLVVLSHEPRFLRGIWDSIDRSRSRPLQLARVGEQNTTITNWDIEHETRGDYEQKIGLVRAFVDQGEGDRRQVAQTLRPILEEHYRFGFPGSFERNEWLGDFIAKIRAAREGESIYCLTEVLEDLEDINGYARRYHHAENPGAEHEPIDEGELTSYARRVLRLVRAY